MKNLREFVTADDLDEAVRLLDCPPHMLPVCNSIRIRRSGSFVNPSMVVFRLFLEK